MTAVVKKVTMAAVDINRHYSVFFVLFKLCIIKDRNTHSEYFILIN